MLEIGVKILRFLAGFTVPLCIGVKYKTYAVIFGLIGAPAVFPVNDLLVNSHARHDEEGDRHQRETDDPPQELPVVGSRRSCRGLCLIRH